MVSDVFIYNTLYAMAYEIYLEWLTDRMVENKHAIILAARDWASAQVESMGKEERRQWFDDMATGHYLMNYHWIDDRAHICLSDF